MCLFKKPIVKTQDQINAKIRAENLFWYQRAPKNDPAYKIPNPQPPRKSGDEIRKEKMFGWNY